MGIAWEILAPKLGANGILPGSAEPVGLLNQWWPASPPPSAGGRPDWALSQVCGSCAVLTYLSFVCGPFLLGMLDQCVATGFVSLLGLFHFVF
jgi:hypothetical protein